MTSELITIGRVARSHGVRGVVRLHVDNPDSDIVADLDELRVGERTYAIETCSRDKQEWLVKLAGVEGRDAADALRGQPILVPRDALPEPDDDELYVFQLVGCTLVDTAGAVLGVVTSVEHNGAHELLLIKRDKGEAMVPFVEPIVVSVDLDARRIVCDPPEGLLDEA